MQGSGLSLSAASRRALAGALALAASACVPRAELCAGVGECGGGRACVAGRCQPPAGVPAIQQARRVVAEPVALAFVHRDDPGAGTVARLGAGDGATLLLRFALRLPAGAHVVEAYLLLERDEGSPAAPVTLHLARIEEPWQPGVPWALSPRVGRVASPRTRVPAVGPSSVRLDARGLVARWMTERDPRDFGVAVVATAAAPPGVAVRLAPGLAPGWGAAGADDEHGASRSGHGPRLELYVK